MEGRNNLLSKYEHIFKETENLSNENFIVKIRWEQIESSHNELENIPIEDAPKGCLSLAFQCVIDSDGKVYTCNGHWREDKFCYGDLHNESFVKIMNNLKRKKLVEDLGCNVDYKECYYPCRHQASNNVLWDLRNQPNHIGLI